MGTDEAPRVSIGASGEVTVCCGDNCVVVKGPAAPAASSGPLVGWPPRQSPLEPPLNIVQDSDLPIEINDEVRDYIQTLREGEPVVVTVENGNTVDLDRISKLADELSGEGRSLEVWFSGD